MWSSTGSYELIWFVLWLFLVFTDTVLYLVFTDTVLYLAVFHR